MRLRVVSKHLGMFASAFALCGLTFVGSAGAGMLDISSTSPVNHLVVRPHLVCREHEVCRECPQGREECKKEQQEHQQEQQQEHQQEMEIQRLRTAMSHFASSEEESKNAQSAKSAQSAQSLPYTGSDPGNHRLP